MINLGGEDLRTIAEPELDVVVATHIHLMHENAAARICPVAAGRKQHSASIAPTRVPLDRLVVGDCQPLIRQTHIDYNDLSRLARIDPAPAIVNVCVHIRVGRLAATLSERRLGDE